jgi:hypothetical protein
MTTLYLVEEIEIGRIAAALKGEASVPHPAQAAHRFGI